MVDVTEDATAATVAGVDLGSRPDLSAVVVLSALGIRLEPWQHRLLIALDRLAVEAPETLRSVDVATMARKYPPAPPARPSAFSLTADGERRPFGFQPNRRERRAAVAAGRRHRRSDG